MCPLPSTALRGSSSLASSGSPQRRSAEICGLVRPQNRPAVVPSRHSHPARVIVTRALANSACAGRHHRCPSLLFDPGARPLRPPCGGARPPRGTGAPAGGPRAALRGRGHAVCPGARATTRDPRPHPPTPSTRYPDGGGAEEGGGAAERTRRPECARTTPGAGGGVVPSGFLPHGTVAQRGSSDGSIEIPAGSQTAEPLSGRFRSHPALARRGAACVGGLCARVCAL